MADIEFLSVPQAAEAMGLPVTGLHQLLRDGRLIALLGADRVRRVPALLLQGGEVVKALPSVITQLRDARFGDEEIVDWLFRDHEVLGAPPIELLRANRATDVRRQAQLAGY